MNDNLVSILNFPIPKNKENIRQLLGKINFYHKYIKDATKILEPLHNLLCKNVGFKWSDQCQESFDKIKEYLTLAIFDRSKSIYIYTDASIEGIGAVLKQPQLDGSIMPVAYFSKKLTEGQKRKEAVFLECLAIKEAVKFWQYWLLGSKFTVYSDHKPLENLGVNVRTDEELGDMMNYLTQFNFNIVYNPGHHNEEAVCLSRNPVLNAHSNLHNDIIRTANYLIPEEIISDQKNIIKDKDTSLENGVLYNTKNNKKQIILTEARAKMLVHRVHNELGHIGMDSLIRTIVPYYCATNIYKIMKEVARNCMVCIKNKTHKGRKFGFLGHLGPAVRPFQIMSLDTIGGFGGRRSTQ
mgnify:CR=1 FL=1